MFSSDMEEIENITTRILHLNNVVHENLMQLMHLQVRELKAKSDKMGAENDELMKMIDKVVKEMKQNIAASERLSDDLNPEDLSISLLTKNKRTTLQTEI